MIGNIDNNEIKDILTKTLYRYPDSVKAAQNNGPDVSLQVNYAAIIKQATETPQTDANVIQNAKELLLTGRLETDDNIRTAAEYFFEYSV